MARNPSPPRGVERSLRLEPSLEIVRLAVAASTAEWAYLGLRVHGAIRAPRVGATLADSRRYIDGRATRQRLHGLSTIGVTTQTVGQALRDLDLLDRRPGHGGYAGGWLILVGGPYAARGEDLGESVIAEPRVLAVWRNPGATHGA